VLIDWLAIGANAGEDDRVSRSAVRSRPAIDSSEAFAVERSVNGKTFAIDIYLFDIEDQFGDSAASETAMIRLKGGRFMSPPPLCPRVTSFD